MADRVQQVAVIATRRRGDEVTVCLIRRKGTSKWSIPKGFIDRGDSPEQAALTEADEEAGLTGTIAGDAVGTYGYGKQGEFLIVAVYVMNVAQQRREWLEMRFRERRWFSLDETGSLLSSHPVQPLWERIKSRIAPAK
jgi:8-oxo-dGTP pyrophosphatase MutT (NUDIX family)